MSDNYTQSDDDNGDDDRQTPAELREAVKRGNRAKAEAETLRRENVFLRAGIDPDDTRLRYFVKGYDGELEPDAIRTAAVEAGFVQAPQQPVDAAVQQAQAGQAAVVAAATGVVPSFDESAVDYQMEQAYAEGGLQGLSDVAQQYGVTFNPTPV
jgi:ribosomal protein L12E/L44/L45/RPP1/RPP2